MDSSTALENLKSMSLSHHKENLHNILPTFLEYFDCDKNRQTQSGIIEIIRIQSLKCVTVDEINYLIFKPLFDKVKECFIACILKLKGNSCEMANTELHMMIDLLLNIVDLFIDSVDLLASEKHPAMKSMYHLPMPLLTLTKEAFVHCKEYENIYSEGITSLKESLTKFYSKAQDLLLKFLVLFQNIHLDTLNEVDVSTFAEACDEIFAIAKIISKMDVKLMASVWKYYVKLLCERNEVLKDRFDIAAIIKFLSDETKSSLAVIDQDCTNEKLMCRSIKLSNFNLKIIITLCDKYRNYLGDCYSSLFDLILILFSYCPPGEKSWQLPSIVIDELNKYLKVGIEPLVLHLISDSNFIDLVTNKEMKPVNQHLSLCLLYFHILPHIMSLDVDVVTKWSSSDGNSRRSILMAIFDVIEHCGFEFELPVYVPGIMCQGKAQRLVSLYEYICSILCGYTASLGTSHFQHLEKQLAACLCSGNQWKQLIASDVFCFIARFGSAQLCLDYCTYFSKMCIEHDCSFQYIHLVCRMVKFMADSDKVMYLKNFPIGENTKFWVHICMHVDVPSVFTKCQNFINLFTGVISNYMQDPGSPYTFNDMVNALNGLENLMKNADKSSSSESDYLRLKDLAIKLWDKVDIVLYEHKMSSEFISALLRLCSQLLHVLPNEILLRVLYVVRHIIQNDTREDLILVGIGFLEQFAFQRVKETPQQDSIIKLISDCFSVALSHNENYFVKEFALEAFEKLAKHTCHDDIVYMCLKKDKNLKTAVSLFIDKVPHESQNDPIILERYLKNRPVNTFKTDDKLVLSENPAKKRRVDAVAYVCDDERLHKVINHMREGIEAVETIFNEKRETPEFCGELERIGIHLSKYCKSMK